MRFEKILNEVNKEKQNKQNVVAAFEQLILQVKSIEKMLQNHYKQL